jgi:hypothetical protein
VIAELPSPYKNLLARVNAVSKHGTYTLEVRDVRKGDVLAERTIAASVVYPRWLTGINLQVLWQV